MTASTQSSGRTPASDRAGGRAATASDPATAVETMRGVMDTVAATAGDVVARIPDAADGAREAIVEASRLVDRRSEHTLQLVGAASTGLAVGLLVGGAPRLLVVAALVPAAFIAASLMERTAPTKGAPRLQGS